MSMKYKLLLCVVVLLACTATLFAGTTVIYKQTFVASNADKGVTDPLNYSKWSFGGNWLVVSDVTAKLPVGAIPAEPAANSGGPLLVYQTNGDYEANIDPTAYVTTLPINCSTATSVQLSFARSLTVEDSKFDQATVQVSNNGTSWVTIYQNPSSGKDKLTDNTTNLTSTAWHTVTYDISATADKQAAVRLRWGLHSNQNNNNGGSSPIPQPLRGWAIDDITLTGAAGDAFYTQALTGTTFPDGFVASGPLWQIGPPLAGGGQHRLADPSVPGVFVDLGRDPGTLPAGDAAGSSIIGTGISLTKDAANYPAGMNASFADSLTPLVDGVKVAPQYLTWGPLDFTGLQNTTLAFQSWLNVGAFPRDKVSIQVHVKNADLDGPIDAATIKDDKTANTINLATAKVVYPVSTSEYYAQQDGLADNNNGLKVTFKYNTNDLAEGDEQLVLRYTLDVTAGTPVWKTFVGGGTVTTNTNNNTDAGDGKGVVKVTFGRTGFQSAADYILAQDNAKFGVGAFLQQSPSGTALADGSKATAIISEAKVVGVLWKYVFQNSTTETLADNGTDPGAWSPWAAKDGNLAKWGADNNDHVWVRWSIGPTDSGFETEYGGWSIADPQIVEASREWAATPAETLPKGMQWEKTNSTLAVPAKNTGTAVWNDSFSIFEVKGVTNTGDNPGEPSIHDVKTVGLTAPDADPISRWSVDSIPVSGTVVADATFTFKGTLTAPPLTSVTYPSPIKVTDPGDPDLSKLSVDWDLANETFDGEHSWLPTYRGTSIANGGIVTSRFPDDGPGSAGEWARFWTEELAGRVPMVVQGFGDGTYRPAQIITRDQIAVYMARARGLALNPVGETGTVFSDVPAGNWTSGAIEACASTSPPIVTGFSDRTYRPTLEITRDAMAKFVALGAGMAIQPILTTPALTKDQAQALVDGGWFPDVPLYEDPDTSAVEHNVFADYINTLVKGGVVTGYAEKNADDETFFTYRPANKVDRASLAVYVWRAFMASKASTVVLGGPAITDVEIATDGTLGNASYYGYSNAGSSFVSGPFKDDAETKGPFAVKYGTRLVTAGDQDYAYVTFDALRLAFADRTPATGPDDDIDVTFELRRVVGTTGPLTGLTFTTAVPKAELDDWTSGVAAGNGDPYRNVVWAIPTGLQGDFELVVTVQGTELGRKPVFSVRGNLGQNDGFDLGIPGWALFGQPTSPGPKTYPADYIAGNPDFEANTDLYKGDNSVELRQTQQIVKRFFTGGRHNIRLGLRYTQANLTSTGTVNVEWSNDYGTKGPSAHWTAVTGFPLTGPTAVGAALQKDPKYYELPNGSPNVENPVVGADDNDNFAIRLSMNAGTDANARVYFDTLTLDGT